MQQARRSACPAAPTTAAAAVTAAARACCSTTPALRRCGAASTAPSTRPTPSATSSCTLWAGCTWIWTSSAGAAARRGCPAQTWCCRWARGRASAGSGGWCPRQAHVPRTFVVLWLWLPTGKCRQRVSAAAAQNSQLHQPPPLLLRAAPTHRGRAAAGYRQGRHQRRAGGRAWAPPLGGSHPEGLHQLEEEPQDDQRDAAHPHRPHNDEGDAAVPGSQAQHDPDKPVGWAARTGQRHRRRAAIGERRAAPVGAASLPCRVAAGETSHLPI